MNSCNLKRMIDIIVSLILLTILSPLILVVSILVKCNLGSPIIFCQVRPGIHGNPFKFYKFRSMLNIYDENGSLLPDGRRLTKIGKFIRKMSFDEIPNLFSVLKGDMSLVGPRPLLMEFIPYYSSEQARRMNVKPGMTGWAQIHGRNAIEYKDRFLLDVWYVDNGNVKLDLKIIFITVWKVFKREGIHYAGCDACPKFTGEN